MLCIAFLASAAVDAQIRSEPTAAVIGRAPVVTIEITNETSPGNAPVTGEMLRAAASAVDPDGDTITGTTYRWLRGTTEVGTNPTYTTVAADVGTLTVEATATTNPATTDPASGTGTATIDVGGTAPRLASVAIPNKKSPVVGQLLNANVVGYTDAEGDPAGTHEYQWYRGDVPIDGATANTYTVVAADVGAPIALGVVPKSSTGTPDTGLEVKSAATDAVVAQPTINVTQAGSTYSHTAFNFNQWMDGTGDTYFVVAPGQSGLVTGPGGSMGSASNGTYSVVTVTARSGEQVKLRGTRDHVACTTYMNSHVRCGAYGESRLALRYFAADNLQLPAGTHEADFQLEARVHPTTATNPPFRILVTMRIESAGPLMAEANEAAQLLTTSEPYSFQPLTASGGTPPYTYSIEGGTLPSGLGLNGTTGEISGTPDTTQPASNVVFSVKDATNAVATTLSTVRFTVLAPLSATPDQTAQVLTVGQADYRFDPFTAAAGGTPPYKVEVHPDSTLPDGLRIDPTSNAVIGSPSAPFAATSVVFVLKDAEGRIAAATSTVSFTGISAVTATADTTEQILTVGQDDYSFHPLTEVDGGVAPYTFEATGVLPTNVTLNATTGEVSGKPTAPRVPADVTFRVKDANGAYSATTSIVKFTVNAAMSATAITTPRALNKGVEIPPANPGALDVLGSLAGGTRPWTCEVSSGTLPVDVTVGATASTCRLNGTPTVQQAASAVTFRVRDANGVYATTSSTVNISVNGNAPTATELAITGDSLVGAQLTASYEYDDADGDLEATGTAATDTSIDWCRTGDQCNLAGNFKSRTYTVQAGDVGKQIYFKLVPRSATGTPSAGQTYTSPNFPATGTVVAALSATPDQTAQVLTVGQTDYRFDPFTAATGGTPPYKVEVHPDSTLPDGLRIDPTSNAVIGSPSAPFAATSVVFVLKDAEGRIAAATSTVSFTGISAVTATADTTEQILTVGQDDYSFHPLTEVDGGVAPYTFEATGVLPTNVTLNATTGEVSGKPTAPRVPADVTFRVKDANGAYSATTSIVKFTVNAAISATAITTPRTYTVNVAPTASAEVMGVSGGTKPWTCEVSVGTLPEGLSLAPTGTTCRVSGTPEEQFKTAELTFRVRDANGVYAATTSKVNFTVSGAILVVSDLKIEGDLIVGSTVTASYEYTDADGDLEGASLIEWCRWGVEPCTQLGRLGDATDPLTYIIQAGDVNAGFHFRVTPKSATGNPDGGTRVTSGQHTHPVSPGISATPDNTARALPVGVEAPAMDVLTASGGKTPYMCEVAAGSTLPAGLQLTTETTTCRVSGTPTTQQAATSVTFRVKDANGTYATASSIVSLTVNGRVPVAKNVRIAGDFIVGSTLEAIYDFDDPDGDLEGATVYEWCRRNFTCEGTSTGKTYTLVEADVGRHINGSVTPKSATGTPDTGAKVDFGTPTTEEWKVVRAISATPDTTAQVLAAGQSHTFTPLTNVSGGRGAYTYDIASGTLPEGLTFSATGVVGGSPTTAQAAADVVFRVKDATGAAVTSTVSYAVNASVPVASEVTVTGIAVVGEELTIEYKYDDAEGDAEDTGATRFRWYRADAIDGEENVVAGPGNQWRIRKPLPADVGKYLRGSVEPVSVGAAPNTGVNVKSSNWLLVLAAVTATPNTTSQVLPVNQVAAPFTPLSGASGGTAPYTYEVHPDSTLPAELRLDAGTGAVEGTPTQLQPSTNVVFRVKDANGVYSSTTSTVRYEVTGNKPVARDIAVEGTPAVGELLEAKYEYFDAEGDDEDVSRTEFAWYRADDATGTNEALVSGPSTAWRTRVVDSADAGKYLRVGIRAASLTGTPNTGDNVKASTWVLARASSVPVATEVGINGTLVVGQELEGTYVYDDAEDDAEGASTFLWYRADDATGTNRTAIPGATAAKYVLVAADQGKYVTFEVTPQSQAGTPSPLGQPARATTATAITGRAPMASEVDVTGVAMVGEELTIGYKYDDADGDVEDTSATRFRWYLADTIDGTENVVAGPGNAWRTRKPLAAEAGKYLRASVEPESVSGTPNRGANVKSTRWLLVLGAITASPNTSPQLLTVGQDYSFSPLTSVAGGTGPYRYEVTEGTLPSSLALDPNTGEVGGTPIAVRTAADVVFSVKDANGVYSATTAKVSFSVNAAISATPDSTARVLTVGVQAPAMDVLTASGGKTPYMCEVAAGSTLPAGLQLTTETTTCRVSGTPTTQQPATSVTFRVKDANGVYATASGTVNFTVNGRVPVAKNVRIEGDFVVGSTLEWKYDFEDPDGDLEGATVYEWCRRNVTCDGTSTTKTYKLVEADVGNHINGSVTPKSATGTPNTGAKVDYGTPQTAEYLVLPGISATADTAARTLTAGVEAPSIDVLTASGGKTPYTCELAAGSTLPAGLQLEIATTKCRVTGRPTTQQSATAVTFRVKDANGTYAAASSTVSFTVNGRVPVATNVRIEGNFVVGSTLEWKYDFTDPDGDLEGATVYEWCRRGVTCDGTSTGKTYKLVEADVGNHINGSVTPKSATGTPNTGAKVDFSTQQTDEWKVVRAISATANTTAQVLYIGQGHSFTPLTSVSGGRQPYTYDIQLGTLPQGVTLSTTGVVSGTPTTARTAADVVFRVRDATGGAVTARVSIAVTVQPLTATPTTTAQELTVGRSHTFNPLTASGGTQPYTYEIQSGTLPAGLTLNASSGAVTGTPTATRAPANVVFRVKDATGTYASTTSTVSYSVYSILAKGQTILDHIGAPYSWPESATYTAFGSGNASSSAKILVRWTVWNGNSSTDHIRLYLVGPTGTRTMVGTCNTGSSGYQNCQLTANLSGHPKAGTWRIEAESTTTRLGTWAFERLEITF